MLRPNAGQQVGDILQGIQQARFLDGHHRLGSQDLQDIAVLFIKSIDLRAFQV